MRFVHDRRHLPARLAVLRAGVVVVFAVLAACFWYFQVLQHQRFLELAQNNHLRTLPLRAPRGTVFDRDGRVLVENRNAFNISVVREQTRDMGHTLSTLSRITGIPQEEFEAAVARHAGEPRYRPVLLVADASFAHVAAVLARRLELPDLLVQQVPTRHYPTDEMAAHLFGYVGEITEQQLERAARGRLAPGAIIGQSGLEQLYNDSLMGLDGARQVVVNSAGREIEVLGERPPTEGTRLRLTIDADLQRAVEEGFRATGYWGAAAVLDPRSGEILSLVSLPAYDPNSFAAGIDRRTWAQLNTDRLRPLQNRAIQGRYSPGSTFKIVVATAALEEGLVTPDHRVHCGGGATFYGRYFKCHLAGGHGSMDMRHAIEKSCNVYFYTLGNMLGVDRIHKWAQLLGLAGKTGIDLPHEVESLVPSTEWKRRRTGEKWYAGETISVAIGQGQVSVTPLALATMMATVANGGTRHVPHLVQAVDEGEGWKPVPAPAPRSVTPMRPENVAALHDGLWMAVNGAGTAGRARLVGYDVSGKTGTAQVISIQGRAAAKGTDRDLRDHGWFVFFAPRDNPQIAGVIFAEHSEHGYLAAPIARHLIDTYFAKREGRALPVYPGTAAPPAPAPVAPDVAPDVVAASAGQAPPAAPPSAASAGSAGRGGRE